MRNINSHIGSMYHIEISKRWEMITHTLSWAVINFAWGLLESFDKYTENESYQFSKLSVLQLCSTPN